MGEP
jgi:hypothetical protein